MKLTIVVTVSILIFLPEYCNPLLSPSRRDQLKNCMSDAVYAKETQSCEGSGYKACEDTQLKRCRAGDCPDENRKCPYYLLLRQYECVDKLFNDSNLLPDILEMVNGLDVDMDKVLEAAKEARNVSLRIEAQEKGADEKILGLLLSIMAHNQGTVGLTILGVIGFCIAGIRRKCANARHGTDLPNLQNPPSDQSSSSASIVTLNAEDAICEDNQPNLRFQHSQDSEPVLPMSDLLSQSCAGYDDLYRTADRLTELTRREDNGSNQVEDCMTIQAEIENPNAVPGGTSRGRVANLWSTQEPK